MGRLSFSFYQCPHCSTYFKEAFYNSISPYYTIRYSDGYFRAPDNSWNHKISKCSACKKVFWLGEDIDAPYEENFTFREKLANYYKPYKGIRDLRPAGIETYAEAIREGLVMDEATEKEFRMNIWWWQNQQICHAAFEKEPKYNMELYQINCRALLYFLDPDDEYQRIQMAEVNRNLKRFSECLQLLRNINLPYLQEWKFKLAQACFVGYHIRFDLNIREFYREMDNDNNE